MTHNLRSRSIREQLLYENEEQEDIDEYYASDEETNDVSEQSRSDTEEESFELDDELQDVTAKARLPRVRTCGRLDTNLRGGNGFEWSATCTTRKCGRQSESHRLFVPGPINTTASTLEEFWDVLFDNSMIELIVFHTNNKIEDVCARMMAANNEMHPYHHLTDATEIRAYIGLLYYGAGWKQSKVKYERLWDKSNGMTPYRIVMSQARYMFLASCLRFDDEETRNDADKFAPVRKIWSLFIRNCRKYYTPHHNCTVGEQFLDFRGRCSFKIRVRTKPDKYGLKIMSLNDAATSYMYYAMPYLGKTSIPANETVPEYFLRHLTAPIHGSGRTVTCDNWFTTVPTALRLLKSPYHLNMTGMIRKNKPEIPPEMKLPHEKTPFAKYCSTKDLTLLSYTPDKNKVVLILSTHLHDREETNGKPEIVDHYNKTKDGTDSFDTLCRGFTVSRRTNRWPMRIFYRMLDQAAVNARVLLKCKNNVNEIGGKDTAENCLNVLYLHLVKHHLQERLTSHTIRKDIKMGITNILNVRDDSSTSDELIKRVRLMKQARCEICRRDADRKTTSVCPSCKRAMCDLHRAYTCNDCVYSVE